MFVANAVNGVRVKAYAGDTMTLLAFDLDPSLDTSDFVGFSIRCHLPSGKSYYLFNMLNFDGAAGLQDSDAAPIQKFRWLHVPGLYHQELNKFEEGNYTYDVTPRYWDAAANALKSIDAARTVSVTIRVGRFADGPVELAFTRSYVESQAYVRRFAADTAIVPKGDWLFDPARKPFTTHDNVAYSYEDLYEYLGFTARRRILELLDEVVKDANLSLEVFAYDFNEPDVAARCLALARQGRIRMILDDSVSKQKDKKTGKVTVGGHGAPRSTENAFAKRFASVRKGAAAIVRGHFARYQHHKVMIVLKKRGGKSVPVKVLSGSTNFSVTGLCVNANHVVVFNDAATAMEYHQVFQASWGVAAMKGFAATKLAGASPFTAAAKGMPATGITYAPHKPAAAATVLARLAKAITGAKSNVLFSVMQLAGGGPVMPALLAVQNNPKVFSYGISDAVNAVALYKPGSRRGILVNAMRVSKSLPKPFQTEDDFKAHKIHHKFVVVDFNTPNAAVYFGSSNLALGGEKANGDNLICVRDPDVVTAFAIEAIRLVDHYLFRASQDKATAAATTMLLRKTNVWAAAYFDPNDVKCVERKVLG